MSYLDIPGQLANIVYMSVYPLLLTRGGWGLVFRTLQGTTFAGAAAMTLFQVLDARQPTQVFSIGCKESKLQTP